MVHVFHYHGHHYLYDTGSGALHECDEKTARHIAGEPVEWTDEELKAALADIEGLKDAGLLYKEEVAAAPVKSHEVKALCLHICHDCNLRCKYCFADEGAYHAAREMMSPETAKKAIDFLIQNSGKRKVLEVDFFGGEPLMNLDVIKATVAYAKEEAAKRGKRFLFTTTTNGLLLDDDAIEFLNAEMENVVLSLDGRKEVHDAVRKTVNGKGSFDAVIDKIKKFVRIRGDKHYYVRGTFTAKNLDFSKDVLFLADQGFSSLSVEPVVTDIPELQIREEHLPVIEQEYEKLCDEYIRREAEGKGFSFFHFHIDLEGGPCLQKRVSACGAGNEYFSVVPNGDIYPCHQFAGDAKWKMGNVFDLSINKEMKDNFARATVYHKSKCQECWAKFYCSGGCNANNWQYMGNILDSFDLACEMEKKRLECAIMIQAALAD